MIGRSGERGSGISVLAARHDDDDDDIYIYIHICIYIYIYIYILLVSQILRFIKFKRNIFRLSSVECF